jgi:error-prone DNA polymerase
MLSAVERCVDEIARVRSRRIDLSRIPSTTARSTARSRTPRPWACFQIESRAQMQMLSAPCPRRSTTSPCRSRSSARGRSSGGAVHPYIERRKACAPTRYRVPMSTLARAGASRDTLGAIVFQDQVIEVAMAFAGFSPGGRGAAPGDVPKRSEAAMRSYEEKFVAGAMARGVARVVAERVYGQIVGFSGFGFPKAHSAAFGSLAYQSTWLRVHYAPESWPR